MIFWKWNHYTIRCDVLSQARTLMPFMKKCPLGSLIGGGLVDGKSYAWVGVQANLSSKGSNMFKYGPLDVKSNC